MTSSLCSAASQKKYVSSLWQCLSYLDQPVNSFPQARRLQIPSTVTMSSFPDPSFFSVFTDPSQVFFSKRAIQKWVSCSTWSLHAEHGTSQLAFRPAQGKEPPWLQWPTKTPRGMGSAACPTSPTCPFLSCHLLALFWESWPPIVPQIHEPVPTSELLLFCYTEHTPLPDAYLVLSSPLSVFNPMAPGQWILWPFYLPGLPFPALFLSFICPTTQNLKYFIHLPVSFPAVDWKFSDYNNFCLYNLFTADTLQPGMPGVV